GARGTLVFHVYLVLVEDSLVLSLVLRQGICVRGKLVSHDHVNGFVHVLSDDLIEGFLLQITGLEEAESAVSLADANNDILFSFALYRSFAADESLVHFDGARQFWLGCLY